MPESHAWVLKIGPWIPKKETKSLLKHHLPPIVALFGPNLVIQKQSYRNICLDSKFMYSKSLFVEIWDKNQATDETIIPKPHWGHLCLSLVMNPKKIISNKKGLGPVHAPWHSTYGAFTLDVKLVLNENLSCILSGTWC
jgi:hypothetical protein